MTTSPRTTTTQSPAIERLPAEDWARLRAVRLRSLLEDPEPFWRTHEEESAMTPEEWRARLGDPARATLVARRNGSDVGLLSIGPPSWDETADPRDFDLAGMWVAPEARGTGASALLIAAAVEHSRSLGARAITLWVLDNNAHAIALYERLGFAATGRTGVFPPPRNLAEHERRLPL